MAAENPRAFISHATKDRALVERFAADRRFDIGFNWFNRHFDLERKPLQSIGLVAGALVAVVYWAAVIVSRVVG